MDPQLSGFEYNPEFYGTKRLFAMLLMTKATLKQIPFKLATDTPDGGWFDDVGLYNETSEEWWIFQIDLSGWSKELTMICTTNSASSLAEIFKTYGVNEGESLKIFKVTNRERHQSAVSVNELLKLFEGYYLSVKPHPSLWELYGNVKFSESVIQNIVKSKAELAEEVRRGWNRWIKSCIPPDVFRRTMADQPMESFKDVMEYFDECERSSRRHPSRRRGSTDIDGTEIIRRVKDSYVKRCGGQGYGELFVGEQYYVNRCIVSRKQQKSSEKQTDDEFRRWLCEDWSHPECIVLLAEAGMGKTTLWQYLASRVQKRNEDVEVYLIYLVCLAQNFRAVDANMSVEEATEIMKSVISVKSIETLLSEKSNVVVFLDAFDELRYWNRQNVLNFIKILMKSKKNVKILINSRECCRKELENNYCFKTIEVQPFDADNRLDYLKSFWGITEFYSYSVLLDRIEHDLPKINFELPLNMKILAEIIQSPSEYLNDPSVTEPLSLSIISFYDGFMRRRIEINGGHIFDYQLLAMRQMLMEYMVEEIHRTQLYDFYKRIHAEGDDSRLLVKVNERYQFTHCSFAEYLCAKYLCDTYASASNAINLSVIENVKKVLRQHPHIRLFFMQTLDLQKKLIFFNEMGETGIIWASEYDCVNLLAHVEKADKEITDEHTTTLLHIVAEFKALNSAKVLLKSKINVNVEDELSFTPLSVACQKGHLSMVQLFVERKANVNHRLGTNVAPLYLAAQNGHCDIVEYLIEKGAVAFPKCKLSDHVPLHVAASEGYPEIVQVFIRNKTCLNLVNSAKETALFRAAAYGHLAVVKCLLEAGADMSQSDYLGWTPLHVAALEGYPDIVELLVERGANTTAVNYNKQTALHVAQNRLDRVKSTPNLVNSGNESESRFKRIIDCLIMGSGTIIHEGGGLDADAAQDENLMVHSVQAVSKLSCSHHSTNSIFPERGPVGNKS